MPENDVTNAIDHSAAKGTIPHLWDSALWSKALVSLLPVLSNASSSAEVTTRDPFKTRNHTLASRSMPENDVTNAH